MVRENDHPYGLFEFLNSTSSLMLAEDGENSTDVTFEVERTMGTDGFVTVTMMTILDKKILILRFG